MLMVSLFSPLLPLNCWVCHSYYSTQQSNAASRSALNMPKKDLHYGSSLSATLPNLSSNAAKTDPRQRLAAQMREKAAANNWHQDKQTSVVDSFIKKLAHHLLATSSSLSKTLSSHKATGPDGSSTKSQTFYSSSTKNPMSQMSSSKAAPPSTSNRNMKMTTPSGKGKKVTTDSVVKKIKSSPCSPMDTYEMSDEENNSDNDSVSSYDSAYGGGHHKKAQKHVPTWAEWGNLNATLEQQLRGTGNDDDGIVMDPDKIFGEIETCDLSMIFQRDGNARYRTRMSLANWHDDRATAVEKLAYKRTAMAQYSPPLYH